MKYNLKEEIKLYKARLVAKGYTYIEGINFHKTIPPIVKLVIVILPGLWPLSQKKMVTVRYALTAVLKKDNMKCMSWT